MTMRATMRFLLALVVLALLAVAPASAQTQAILPNGMTQFSDGNGAPYAGGRVYMYVPLTTTPKATYQDPFGHTPNSNPITLDANGRGVIWGNGEYRQVLQDLNGVVVWDQLTYASPAGTSGGASGAIWYGTATGTANAITLATPSGFVATDGQTVGFIASSSNTASTTINASGYGSILVEKNTIGGPAVLAGGEIVAGNLAYATYSASANAFILTAALPPPGIGVATAITSGATTDLGTVSSHNASITGGTTITSFGSSASTSWPLYLVQFQGVLQVTESGALLTPSGGNITTAVGDTAWVLYLGAGNWQILQYNSVTVVQPLTVLPQVRLSTVSSSPLSAASASGVATVYAVPYQGNVVPLWNGTAFVPTACPVMGNVLANSATGNAGPAAAVAASVYDLVAWNNAGTCTLTRDVAWTNVTTPAAGDAFARVQGILVNSVGITNGPGAGYGTYLGTIATDAGGATVTFNPAPAAASGGPTNGAWVGLWNQYNRLNLAMSEQDSTASWTYAVNTWRAVNASNSNRVSFVTGQAEEPVVATYLVTSNPSNAQGSVGLGLDSVTVQGISAQAQVNAAAYVPLSVTLPVSPRIGLHYIQALEISTANTMTFYGGTSVQMQLSAQLRY